MVAKRLLSISFVAFSVATETAPEAHDFRAESTHATASFDAQPKETFRRRVYVLSISQSDVHHHARRVPGSRNTT